MWRIAVSIEDLHELPPKAAQLLAHFLNISDGSLAHTNDSARFYGFIRYCHSRRVKFTEEQFLQLLIRVQKLADNELPVQDASQLADNLKRSRYQRDVIFYLPQGENTLGIRVLGENMDFIQHISSDVLFRKRSSDPGLFKGLLTGYISLYCLPTFTIASYYL